MFSTSDTGNDPQSGQQMIPGPKMIASPERMVKCKLANLDSGFKITELIINNALDRLARPALRL